MPKIIIKNPTPELLMQLAAEEKVEDWTKHWGVFEEQEEKLDDEENA